MSSPPRLILLTALPAEAKPIRRAFGLVRDNALSSLTVFRKQDRMLLITGVGIQAQTTLETLLQQSQLFEGSTIHWINCGIAGHATLKLGTVVAITRITEGYEGISYSPAPVDFRSETLHQQPLVTLNTPSDDYSTNACIDMEAALLVRLLKKHRPADRFSCLKVISDNRLNSTRGINGKQIEQWISNMLPVLESMIDDTTTAHESA